MAKLSGNSERNQPNTGSSEIELQASTTIDRRTFLQLTGVAAISLPSLGAETTQATIQHSKQHIDNNVITDLEDILMHSGFTDILMRDRCDLVIQRSAQALRTIKELYSEDFKASLTLTEHNSAILEIAIGNLHTVTFKRGIASSGESSFKLPISAADQIDRYTVAQCFLKNRLQDLLPTTPNYIGIEKSGDPLTLSGELLSLISNDVLDWNFA